MATRSAIGYYTEDQKIRAIYCHWDGYPSYNGRILIDNWSKNWEDVEALVEGGDISSLSETLDKLKRQPNASVSSFDDEETFIATMRMCGCEYFYIFIHDVEYDAEKPHWHYCDRYSELRPLKKEDTTK